MCDACSFSLRAFWSIIVLGAFAEGFVTNKVVVAGDARGQRASRSTILVEF
jgi:hypothetical protein